MSNVICNRKMLEKFVISALIRKHINNTRTSIPIEKNRRNRLQVLKQSLNCPQNYIISLYI